MPYKSEKIRIEKTKLDRRIKLNPEQKDKIASLKGTISLRKCAQEYGVDKRTIQFIWYPERLEQCKQRRQERGGWRQYYSKEKWAETMKEHRHYKQELFLEGKINEKRLF